MVLWVEGLHKKKQAKALRTCGSSRDSQAHGCRAARAGAGAGRGGQGAAVAGVQAGCQPAGWLGCAALRCAVGDIAVRRCNDAAVAYRLLRSFCPVPPTNPLNPSCLLPGYLEEDEELDEEGLGEDLQETQRQRMLGGRRPAFDEAEEEARAARLAAAKAGGGAAPGGKRWRIEEEEEEEEDISGEEEEEEEGAEEMKVWAGSAWCGGAWGWWGGGWGWVLRGRAGAGAGRSTGERLLAVCPQTC